MIESDFTSNQHNHFDSFPNSILIFMVVEMCLISTTLANGANIASFHAWVRHWCQLQMVSVV